jgi:hypothetical protein
MMRLVAAGRERFVGAGTCRERFAPLLDGMPSSNALGQQSAVHKPLDEHRAKTNFACPPAPLRYTKPYTDRTGTIPASRDGLRNTSDRSDHQ